MKNGLLQKQLREETNTLMIRHANKSDLPHVLKIYEKARSFMQQTGNKHQWGDKFPFPAVIERDMEKQQLYVVEEAERIHGVFAFIIGEDATYEVIENGSWLSADLYGTIHRLASDGEVKGIFNAVVAYCERRIKHLRIDTHRENKIMRHLIRKNGFCECGTIYVEDGTPRIAYEKING